MKDILFNIYRYNITKDKHIIKNAFDDTQAKPIVSDIDYFEKKCLGNKNTKITLRETKVYKSNDVALHRSSVETCEKEDHNARIIEHKDGITIIEVQANKKKVLHDEDFNEDTVDDHPYFLVIIDNRKDSQYIAIQQGVMSTNKVANILIDTFNHNMLERGRKIDIFKLRKNMSFLDTIFHMKERLGKRISRIALDFDKKVNTTNQLPEGLDHFLKEWIGRFADEGKIEATISNDENLKKTDVAHDIHLISSLCLENPRYKLSAWFGNFGVYRYGKEIGAQFGMHSKIIEDYVNPPKTVEKEQCFLTEESKDEKLPTFEEWLDRVNEIFDDYEKTSLSISGRRRNRRRPL